MRDSLRSLLIGWLLACLTTTATADHRIGGQVVVEGQGLARATVTLLPEPSFYESAQARFAGAAQSEPVATARTDRDGLFELTAPESGMWKIRVEAEGYSPAEQFLHPLLDDVALPKLQLRPAVSVEIRVSDPAGRPLSVRIAATEQDPPNARGNRRTRRAFGSRNTVTRFAHTDDSGVTRLPLSAGQVLALEAVAAGYLPAKLEVRPGQTARLTLKPGRARRVQVVDQRDRALSGVLISQQQTQLPLARTDEAGAASLLLPTDEPIPLWLETPAGHRASLVLDPPAAERAKEQPEKLVLEDPKLVTGQVIDAETRQLIPRALVWLRMAPGDFVRTDDRGAYEFMVIASEAFALSAKAKGYSRGYATPPADGTDSAISIAVSATSAVSGVVVDAEGRPVGGADVQAVQGSGHQQFWPRPLAGYWSDGQGDRSSPQGHFRITDLAVQQPYRLIVHKPGFAASELALELLERFESRTGVRLVLRQGWRGIGQVVDSDGVPIPAAEVWLDGPTTSRNAGMYLTFAEDTLSPPTLTGSEGRFEFPDLVADRYRLSAAAPGFAAVTIPGIDIPEGSGDFDLGTVSLTPGVAVEGRVVDVTGQPITDVHVHATLAADFANRRYCKMLLETPSTITTDQAGEFSVSDLAEGTMIHLCVGKASYLVAAAEATAPTAQRLEMVLRTASRITGRVVDQKGEPLARAYVGTSKSGMGHQNTETGSDGLFELEGVEPGRNTLNASAIGFVRLELVGFEVPEGGVLRDVELVLEPGTSLSGSVHDAAGRPVMGAGIGVSANGTERLGGGSTDADGRYRVEDVGIGPRVVRVRHEKFAEAAKEFETRAGENALDIVLEAGLEVGGWVFDETGGPVGGAKISLENDRWRSPAVTTQADGSFTISGVPPGSQVVMARKEGYAFALSEAIEIETESVYGVELRLQVGSTLSGRVLGLEIEEMAQLGVQAYSQHTHQNGEADYEGAYTIRHLTPGEWRVSASVGGSGRQAQGRVVIEAGVAEAHLDLDFSVGHTLTGVVLRGDMPLPGLYVSASGSTNSGTATTREDGSFQIENLPKGDYRLFIYDHASGVRHRENITISSDEDVRIELEFGRVAGYVRYHDDSSPVARAEVRLVPRDSEQNSSSWHRQRETRTDSRGFFQIDNAPAGSFKVIATKAGFSPAEVPIELETSGALEDLELLLVATEGVSLEVLAPSGRPVMSARISVLGPAGEAIASGIYRATEGGKVRVPTVPPGSWQLLVAAEDSLTSELDINAPGHLGAVQLRRGGGLRIRVAEFEAQGTLAYLTLLDSSGRPDRSLSSHGTVHSEHRFRGATHLVRGLAPGAWTARVRTEDGREWSGNAIVTAGGDAEVTLSATGLSDDDAGGGRILDR